MEQGYQPGGRDVYPRNRRVRGVRGRPSTQRDAPFSFSDTGASPMHPLSLWKRPTLPGRTRIGRAPSRSARELNIRIRICACGRSLNFRRSPIPRQLRWISGYRAPCLTSADACGRGSARRAATRRCLNETIECSRSRIHARSAFPLEIFMRLNEAERVISRSSSCYHALRFKNLTRLFTRVTTAQSDNRQLSPGIVRSRIAWTTRVYTVISSQTVSARRDE